MSPLGPGVHGRVLRFDAPALEGWSWPTIEIVGRAPGPRVAIVAGVHPNEVAAIEATLQLAGRLDLDDLRGTVSLIPVANEPGYAPRTESLSPVDGRNLNFTFPGSPTGSFTEVLADRLLHEWAGDADCLIDLHGGDLREEIAHYVVAQLVGEPAFDARQLELARAFGSEFLVRLGPEQLANRGRSVTARAALQRHGVFAEGGSHGLLDRAEVGYHLEGMVAVLGRLGMIETAAAPNAPIELTGYHFLMAPVAGWCRSPIRAGQWVEAGDPVAELADRFGALSATVTAPASGYILWRVTHPIVAAGDPIVGLGTSSS